MQNILASTTNLLMLYAIKLKNCFVILQAEIDRFMCLWFLYFCQVFLLFLKYMPIIALHI